MKIHTHEWVIDDEVNGHWVDLYVDDEDEPIVPKRKKETESSEQREPFFVRQHIHEWVDDKNGGHFIDYYRNEDFSATADRHDVICVTCGFPTYPECREWCQNEEWRRERIKKMSSSKLERKES